MNLNKIKLYQILFYISSAFILFNYYFNPESKYNILFILCSIFSAWRIHQINKPFVDRINNLVEINDRIDTVEAKIKDTEKTSANYQDLIQNLEELKKHKEQAKNAFATELDNNKEFRKFIESLKNSFK
ncbi:MAG: hypothetical protein K0Q51_111 [Rickettsiaceae bacterium]|jgi:hypothetical protein|nr:hypothetical protein [Rickettsiaceae bacterium]